MAQNTNTKTIKRPEKKQIGKQDIKSKNIDNSLFITQDIQSRLNIQEERYPVPFYAMTNLMAKHIIDIILQRGAEIIAEKDLQKKLPGYNANQCIWLSEQLAHFKRYPADNRQPWKEWSEDQEPQLQKLENRQVGSVRVVNWVNSKQASKKIQQNNMETEIEILLAQPKLFFKVPDSFKNLLMKKKTDQDIQSSRSLEKYDKYMKDDNSNSNMISYKIQKKDTFYSQHSNENTLQEQKIKEGFVYKAPLYNNERSPQSQRSQRSQTNQQFQITPENKYQELSKFMLSKERNYVRKIIKRETTIKNINNALVEYKDYGDVQDKESQDTLHNKTNTKYLNQVKAYSFKNIQPLNLDKKMQSPKQIKLIDLPRHPIQLDFKPEIRSLSPVYKKNQKLYELNQELFLKKDQDEFKKKVEALTQKKHVHMNFLDPNKTKPAKRPQSPGQLREIQNHRVFNTQEERHERIRDLIGNQKLNIQHLPELSINRHKFPQKL